MNGCRLGVELVTSERNGLRWSESDDRGGVRQVPRIHGDLGTGGATLVASCFSDRPAVNRCSHGQSVGRVCMGQVVRALYAERPVGRARPALVLVEAAYRFALIHWLQGPAPSPPVGFTTYRRESLILPVGTNHRPEPTCHPPSSYRPLAQKLKKKIKKIKK